MWFQATILLKVRQSNELAIKLQEKIYKVGFSVINSAWVRYYKGKFKFSHHPLVVSAVGGRC